MHMTKFYLTSYGKVLYNPYMGRKEEGANSHDKHEIAQRIEDVRIKPKGGTNG